MLESVSVKLETNVLVSMRDGVMPTFTDPRGQGPFQCCCSGPLTKRRWL